MLSFIHYAFLFFRQSSYMMHCSFDYHCCVPENIVEPMQRRNVSNYYHRRYPRVKTVDQCEVDDPVCVYEAQEQYKRDK